MKNGVLLGLLYYFNNINIIEKWERDLEEYDLQGTNFSYPEDWPEQELLVSILAYCLMPNHFHLILKEVREGGISKFMQRISRSMTGYYNAKYQEKGALFQGRYTAKHIEDDDYLTYLSTYVMVKNPLELYPGGLAGALKDKNKALRWASEYDFSSFGSYVYGRENPILDVETFKSTCLVSDDLLSFAHDNLENFHQFKLNRKPL